MTRETATNGIRQRFEDGGVALGVLDNTYSPTLVEFYGDLGVDFVWLDLEHGGPSPWNGERLDDLLRAAERTGTELLVRLPRPEPAMIRKALDAGVRNVFVSQVETESEIRKVVEAGRFSYDGEAGRRGLGAPRARRWGLREDYVAGEDRETLVGVTVETQAAVENLDSILEVPDLGFVFVGPLDLSVSLEHPNELDHDDVAAAVETVRSKAVEAGVPVGGLGFGMDDVNEKAENGYQMLNLGSTTGAIKQTVDGWLDSYDGQR